MLEDEGNASLTLKSSWSIEHRNMHPFCYNNSQIGLHYLFQNIKIPQNKSLLDIQSCKTM